MLSSSRPDSDAQSFILAAGITNPTQIYAIEYLTWGLKYYSLWSKMQAVYPFIGGTSSTSKWNLIDSRDLDAAFRLVFPGGWTFNSNGITPNGTNAFANTYYTPSSNGSLNNQHISVYSRTNNLRNGKDLGTVDVSGTQLTTELRTAANNLAGGVNSLENSTTSPSSSSAGHFVYSRISSGEFKVYRNGSTSATFTQTSGALSIWPLYISALNNAGSGATQYQNRNLALVSMGQGLTDTEASNFYTVVQEYQTILSRQV